jgi:thymidylate kinase
VLQRLALEHPMPTIAPEDRLLILASDAVAGRDLIKVRTRVAEVIERDPDARRRAQLSAGTEDLGAVWEAIEGPNPARVDGSGRLAFQAACRVALRSRSARSALRHRVVNRVAKRLQRLATSERNLRRQVRPRAALITISGMDGSGKTTLAATLQEHLAARGKPVQSSWARLGNETRVLQLVGQPVKRMMGRTGTIADPIVTAGPLVGKHQHPQVAAGHRGPVEWGWTLFVALVATHTQRRRTAIRTRGVHVVCDRSTADALVDLELRYGRNRAAARAIKLLFPRADVALLLEVDADVAAMRKPGDKSIDTLRDMQAAYAAHARSLPVICLDASLPREEVAAQARLLVDTVAGGPDCEISCPGGRLL